MSNETAGLSRRNRLSYGAGAVAFGVKDTGFGYFLLIYYQQVLGLDASLAATALAIAIVIDALSDLLIGFFSDNLKSRWGRRHPLMYVAALPTVVAFYFLWNPVVGMSQTELFYYLTGMAVLVRLLITFYEVPSVALGAELTYEYDARTRLMALRFAFGWWGGLLLIFTAYAFLFQTSPEDPAGTLSAGGYETYGLVSAAVMLVAMLLSAAGTHDRIPALPKAPERPLEGARQILKEIGASLYNKSFLAVFVSRIFAGMAIGLSSNLNIYFVTFFWGLTTDQIAFFPIMSLLAVTAASILAPILSARRNKKTIAMTTALAGILFGPLPILGRLAGILPANDDPWLLPLLAAHNMIETTIAVTTSILVGSMLADIVEDSEVSTGRRNEGLFFAANGFAGKLVSGGGILVAGFILTAISFPRQTSAEDVDPALLTNLALVFVPILMGLYLCSWLALWFYDIDRTRHGANLATVRSRTAGED